MMTRALILVALLASSASADMLDDFHAVPGTLQPLSRAVNGRRIMLIGDSIQAGTALLRDTDQASWRVQKSGNVVIHNFASPGATMADVPFYAGMNHAVEAVRLLSGFFGMYGVLSLLFLFLIYFEVQRGPGAEPQGAAAPIPTPARQQH